MKNKPTCPICQPKLVKDEHGNVSVVRPPLHIDEYNYSGTSEDAAHCPRCNTVYFVVYTIAEIVIAGEEWQQESKYLKPTIKTEQPHDP